MEILSLYVLNAPHLQAEVENDDDDIVEEDEKDGGKTATSVCDTSTSSQMLVQMVFSVMIRGDASREKGPKGRGRGPAGSFGDPNLED